MLSSLRSDVKMVNGRDFLTSVDNRVATIDLTQRDFLNLILYKY